MTSPNIALGARKQAAIGAANRFRVWQAFYKLRIRNARDLADHLGISRETVHFWAADMQLPLERRPRDTEHDDLPSVDRVMEKGIAMEFMDD